MTTPVQKLITVDRVKTLIASYGGRIEAWPEEERLAASALVESSAELKFLYLEAKTLDRALKSRPTPNHNRAHDDLCVRIMENLPQQDPLPIPTRSSKQWWGVGLTGAIAASITIMVLFNPIHTGFRGATQDTLDTFDQWAWEEVLDETPRDAMTGDGIELLAYLEPEFSGDEF